MLAFFLPCALWLVLCYQPRLPQAQLTFIIFCALCVISAPSAFFPRFALNQRITPSRAQYALAQGGELVAGAGGMVRVGPVHYNTLDELEKFGEVLKKVAK